MVRVEKYSKHVDDLVTDLVVTPIFEDERPPLGVSGLIDWRLNGFISRAILNGAVQGKKDEVVLLPLHPRLPARRVLLVGLGKKNQFSLNDVRHVAHRIAKTLKGLGTLDAAIAVPPSKDHVAELDTEKAIVEVLAQENLPNQSYIRILTAPQHEWETALSPLVPPSSQVDARK